jgi:esterase/lipase superfamily enzyme
MNAITTAVSRVFSIVTLGIGLIGCAALDDVTASAPVTSLLLHGEEAASSADTRIRFVTDRASGGAQSYGGAWSPVLSCGTADARVPSHRPPGLSRGRWKTTPIEGKAFANAMVDTVESSDRCNTLLGMGTFARDVALEAQQSPQNDVLIFVQGFNMTFHSAAQTVAQIAHDTEFEGVPLVFSWASTGKMRNYVDDSEKAVLAIPRLASLLTELAAEQGISRVHVIAHSIGANVALAALDSIAHYRSASSEVVIDELILAAPDMQLPVFEALLPRVNSLVGHVTVYASRDDRALRVSRLVHFNRDGRAGNQPKTIRAIPGIDVIDASDAPTDRFGHNYFRNSLPVISDIRSTLMNVRLRGRSLLSMTALRCDVVEENYCRLVAP